MKDARIIMGMPVTVEVADTRASKSDLEEIFSYFGFVDGKFSTYKEDSEVSKINRGELKAGAYSKEMREILVLARATKIETDGYFDVRLPGGGIDPSGIVKGWAIYNAAILLKKKGFENFYVDAGGDIQVGGRNIRGEKWSVGIRNPMKQEEIVKIIYAGEEGVATSGTYVRGRHIYNPKDRGDELKEVLSLTVIGRNIYEADRFATAAFAMGRKGIEFIEKLDGFEGYSIDKNGIATMTGGFSKYEHA